MMGKPTAFHLPLVSNSLPEASVTAGSAAFNEHRSNDAKWAELGWVSIHLQWRCMGAGIQKLSGHYLSLLELPKVHALSSQLYMGG